ncbi:glutathione S-transferase N-terminal domain-containing protein [Paraburkholderia sp. BR10937]|uniref:glutathione S-transferase N-terminal domain-containing protein n=1 Tax=Paraburkholderia sp. BR10937 TaxID=3236994 RepID=UPI0034D2343D
MKLYYSPGACSLVSHIVAREAGIAIELEKVDMASKRTQGGIDFLTINPKGNVPVLELDDGAWLTEGPAIMQFLADLKPERDLVPRNGTMARYRLQEWLGFINSDLHTSYAPLFNPAMPGQHRRGPDGVWELDETLVDERYVAVHIANKGLFVFTACSHAGLINDLTHAGNRFPDVPIYGVLGGFHLSGATESIIPDTVEALEPFNPALIAPAHCTGWRAIGALATRFKDRVVSSAVGKRFVL